MTNQIILLSILFVTILGFSFQDTFAAVDMFLKIEGVEGESKDKIHGKEIDILSLSWSTAMQSSRAGGAGKASVEELSVTKYIDKATPKLFESLVTGKHIAEAKIIVRSAGGNPVEYLKYTLQDIIVTSYSTGSSGEDRPAESVSFSYGKVEVEYTELNPDGTPKQVIVQGWDATKKQAYCPATGGTCGDVPAAAFSPLEKDLVVPKLEEQVKSKPEEIPSWIKNNAKWWAQKQIGDSDFISGIQFMIQQKIILVSGTPGESAQTEVPVPEWVRNNAGWWADDLISEDEFVKALEFLIQNGIIRIS